MPDRSLDDSWGCACRGKQGNAPLCPCKMVSAGIFEKDGNWVKESGTIVGSVSGLTDDEKRILRSKYG